MADALALIGIHFPLFTPATAHEAQPYTWHNTTEVKRTLFFPKEIRDPIVQGMHRAIYGAKGTARANIIRALYENPKWKKDYLELQDRWIGKTGTAEIMYKQSIDAESIAKIHNHIWFGALSFERKEPQTWDKPQLSIIVYLRFSEAGGKEAAPLAAAMIKKWEEICQRHAQ